MNVNVLCSMFYEKYHLKSYMEIMDFPGYPFEK